MSLRDTRWGGGEADFLTRGWPSANLVAGEVAGTGAIGAAVGGTEVAAGGAVVVVRTEG